MRIALRNSLPSLAAHWPLALLLVAVAILHLLFHFGSVYGEQDTARLARERLHPERIAIILVGPAEDIAPQVQDLGPVEIVQP